MRLKNVPTLGTVEITVCIERSTVDSFAAAGYSESCERDLTDLELDYINTNFCAEIQEYAWENGSRNHN